MAARRKGDVCDNYADDAVWDRRHKHRVAGLAAVHRSRDFFAMLSLIAAGEASADRAPLEPRPDDRACSKREWERRVQAWRDAVKSFVQQAEEC